MIELNRVGIFVDQTHQEEFATFLEKRFSSQNIETVLLDWESPKQDDLDLVIAGGGDGTVLFVLGRFPECPVLAINYGTVGFLTAGNRDEMENILQRLIAQDYVISERSMLECIHPQGEVHAVTEVVIKGATRLISVDLSINGEHIRRIRGDGVIVGTATGSTAYLLSAGSPIVMPGVRCMIIAGLNEYNFTARHLVVDHEALIKLVIAPGTHEHDIYLSVDGKNKVSLSIHDEIHIRESKQRARLIFMDSNYFFTNLSSRLSW